MKNFIENVLEAVVVIGVLVGCVWVLKAQDQREYEKAVERCGSANNIVESFTSQGDVYYICKEKK